MLEFRRKPGTQSKEQFRSQKARDPSWIPGFEVKRSDMAARPTWPDMIKAGNHEARKG
jgi:hypothetical protein